MAKHAGKGAVKKAPRSTNPFGRYAAKLLFQFRVDGISPHKPRTCEERIVVFVAVSAKEALDKAKRRGKRSEFSYLNKKNSNVCFEFLGVRELLCLGSVCKRGEVWYDIVKYVISDKRLAGLIPEEKILEAFRNE